MTSSDLERATLPFKKKMKNAAKAQQKVVERLKPKAKVGTISFAKRGRRNE
jgi:hypothetical protein